MKSPARGLESVQKTDIQNNTHQLPHDWSYYVGTSQTDYELDGVGNRKTVIRDGQTETYVTNSVNEYVYVNNQRLMYDQNGNLLDDGEHRLYYNHNNQVVKADRYVSDPTFQHIKMWQYDVLGRRLKVWFANQLVEMPRNMSYDGQRLLAEWWRISPSATTWLHIWVYGNGIDEVLVDLKEGVWYLDDALGSVYALTDGAGNVVEAYQYDIYGQPRFYDGAGQRIERSQYGNVFMFTGRYWEGPLLHLYYYRARYYSPQLGRFLQRDPLSYIEYQYCASRPVILTDPTGLWWLAHGPLTFEPLRIVAKKLGLSEAARSVVCSILLEANFSQDKGKAFLELFRHYNREPNEERWLARFRYNLYILRGLCNYMLHLLGGRCKQALQALGRLLHSWQDFFSHAYHAKHGWDAWTARPPEKGTPDEPNDLWPSSYPGEHPKIFLREIELEPVFRLDAEFRARYNDAKAYTRKKLEELLPLWLPRCRCWLQARAKEYERETERIRLEYMRRMSPK